MKRCENCFHYNIYPNGESYGWCDARNTNTQYASICKYFDILDELVKCENCLYFDIQDNNYPICFRHYPDINNVSSAKRCKDFKLIQKDRNNA